MIAARSPERKSRRGRNTFNHVRARCFLKDHEVGRRGFDHFRQRLFAPHSSESDVVTE
jgi:hypothetical protein